MKIKKLFILALAFGFSANAFADKLSCNTVMSQGYSGTLTAVNLPDRTAEADYMPHFNMTMKQPRELSMLSLTSKCMENNDGSVTIHSYNANDGKYTLLAKVLPSDPSTLKIIDFPFRFGTDPLQPLGNYQGDLTAG